MQDRQAKAHSLQDSWCASCFSHSSAQTWHTITHKAKSSLVYKESLAANPADIVQISIASLQAVIQFRLQSLMQSVRHFSHAITQVRHAAIPFELSKLTEFSLLEEIRRKVEYLYLNIITLF